MAPGSASAVELPTHPGTDTAATFAGAGYRCHGDHTRRRRTSSSAARVPLLTFLRLERGRRRLAQPVTGARTRLEVDATLAARAVDGGPWRESAPGRSAVAPNPGSAPRASGNGCSGRRRRAAIWTSPGSGPTGASPKRPRGGVPRGRAGGERFQSRATSAAACATTAPTQVVRRASRLKCAPAPTPCSPAQERRCARAWTPGEVGTTASHHLGPAANRFIHRTGHGVASGRTRSRTSSGPTDAAVTRQHVQHQPGIYPGHFAPPRGHRGRDRRGARAAEPGAAFASPAGSRDHAARHGDGPAPVGDGWAVLLWVTSAGRSASATAGSCAAYLVMAAGAAAVLAIGDRGGPRSRVKDRRCHRRRARGRRRAGRLDRAQGRCAPSVPPRRAPSGSPGGRPWHPRPSPARRGCARVPACLVAAAAGLRRAPRRRGRGRAVRLSAFRLVVGALSSAR